MDQSENWERIEKIFHAAAELRHDDRARFLDNTCGPDQDLRRKVEALLLANDNQSGFMGHPAIQAAAAMVTSIQSSRLTFGTRLGPYEIIASIGVGGMAEVYRARDSKLRRDVAIKVLPERYSEDRERVARFHREAQLLASLNHSRIAAIYGLEESNGILGLALEFVDGETIAERIAGGRVPIPEALMIARQIAEALQAAHEKGIVHRDLKPANVKITKHGSVKVLDFGLAKMFAASGPDSEAPPTVSLAGTEAGIILGTPSYMSPEQARGQQLDKRTDIWAFGCVLYEMLTGVRAFAGETVSDTIAAVLGREPDWNALPSETPVLILRLLRHCLEKNADRRLHDIADARLEIDDALAGRTEPAQPTSEPRRSARFWRVGIVTLCLVIPLSFALGSWYSSRRLTAVRSPLPRRFVMDVPSLWQYGQFALSPDGNKLVYIAGKFESGQLYVRGFDELEGRLLAGTLRARNPFFSPDGEWVGFGMGGGLKKVPATGGPVVTLCASCRTSGATWGRDGTIVYADAANGGLWRISAEGGTPLRLTTPDPSKDEVAHVWPQLLPEGKGVLFTVLTSTNASRIAVLPLETQKMPVTVVESGSFARYSPTGHIVFARSGNLFAVPFDLARLRISGQPGQVLEGVSIAEMAGARFALADDGTMAFTAAASMDQRSLVWVDRNGSEQILRVPKRQFGHPALSPDGRRLVVEIGGGSQRNLWLLEFATGAFTGVSGAPASFASFPVWTLDGKRIIYSIVVDGKQQLIWQTADGSQNAETVLKSQYQSLGIWPGSWSPDGRKLVFMEAFTGNGGGINVLDLNDGSTQPVVDTPATEWGGKLSPDGRCLAYVSQERGQWEVYIQPFPTGSRRQVSTDGGAEVVWSSSGSELFYRNDSDLTAVPMTTTAACTPGTPKVLFNGLAYITGSPGAHSYDVSRDAQKFVMVRAGENELKAARTIIITLNWFEELKRKVPVPQ